MKTNRQTQIFTILTTATILIFKLPRESLQVNKQKANKPMGKMVTSQKRVIPHFSLPRSKSSTLSQLSAYGADSVLLIDAKRREKQARKENSNCEAFSSICTAFLSLYSASLIYSFPHYSR